MDAATFWHMIESAKAESNGDCDQQARILEQRLATLSPEEIQSFDRILWQQMRLSYDNDLWAAAYIINGGCSDDGFDYFRGWLIVQGEAAFRSALQDPNTLSAYVTSNDANSDGYECGDMLGVAWHAYKDSTGHEMPRGEPIRLILTGEPWEEDELPEKYSKKFPNLWAIFGW
jgi:hypothetical protein